MATSAPNSSPLDRPPPSLLTIPPTTSWANVLSLQLNVLHDHLSSLSPEMHSKSAQKSQPILESAMQTISGAGAIDSAIAALSPFVDIYKQLVNARNETSKSAFRSEPDVVNIESPSPNSNDHMVRMTNRKRLSAPTYAEIAASGMPDNHHVLPRPRPDRANRQAAALFSVPDPGRIVFARLRFSGYNRTAPIANMAILRRALAHSNYRGSFVLIALEDSSIIVGVRKNTIESVEKALHKVVKSFSAAVPQLVFDLQREFNWFHRISQRLCQTLRYASLFKKN